MTGVYVCTASFYVSRRRADAKLQQVAENHSGESLVFFGIDQLLVGMDFRNLL